VVVPFGVVAEVRKVYDEICDSEEELKRYEARVDKLRQKLIHVDDFLIISC